jgi:adenylosuccinate synthase
MLATCIPADTLAHLSFCCTSLQWGDEGKGKLVDILAQTYDVCARVAGGSNAGNKVDLTVNIHVQSTVASIVHL